MIKRFVLPIIANLLLALPPLFWLISAGQNTRHEALPVLTQYLKFLYARDFRQAYRFISAEDRRLKSANDYVRERQPFTGFALDVARKLAGLIEIRPLSAEPDGARSRVTVSMKLPDANGIARLLLDWDDKRLNALSSDERKNMLSTIDGLISANKLPMIEGQEQFILVKEGSTWKIFLDWAAGSQLQFATTPPTGGEIAAEPITKATVVRSGDPFTIGFKVKNRTAKEVVTRIVHRVEPQELTPYLDLVECALLLPVRMRPSEEQIFHSTYVVRGDLPEGTKSIHVTYDFQIENQ